MKHCVVCNKIKSHQSRLTRRMTITFTYLYQITHVNQINSLWFWK